MQDNTAAVEEEKPSSSAKKLLNHWLRFSSGHLESNEGDPELLVYIPYPLLLFYVLSSGHDQFQFQHVLLDLHSPICINLSMGFNLSSISRFTLDVKINSISIIGGADGTSPSKMRAGVVLEGGMHSSVKDSILQGVLPCGYTAVILEYMQGV
ncbi:unnamed protein product [Prunus armeniaca]